MHGADDDAIKTDEKVWDLTQAINVKGVWYGCKHAILAMRKVRLAIRSPVKYVVTYI
jgi:NAD(P)-dependent dehydrogenase (short-subunit alcohol dehydrogenase family)